MSDLTTAFRRARFGQKMRLPVVVNPPVIKPEPPAPVAISANFGTWWSISTAAAPTVRKIQQIVAQHYNIRIAELCSHRRIGNLVWPRQIAMYLARTMTTRSMPEIGRCFGRDHTTVLHAVRKFERLIQEDEKVAAEVEAVKATIV